MEGVNIASLELVLVSAGPGWVTINMYLYREQDTEFVGRKVGTQVGRYMYGYRNHIQ